MSPLERLPDDIQEYLPGTKEVRTYVGEVPDHVLSTTAECFIRVYGGEPWNEAWRCSTAGPVHHFGFAEVDPDQLVCKEPDCAGTLVPYYDPDELIATFKQDFAHDPETTPVLSAWFGQNGEILAYTSTMVTSNWDRTRDFLLRAPYFGGIHVDPKAEIEAFKAKVLPIVGDQAVTVVLDTVSRPEVRGLPAWYQTVFEASLASIMLGTRQFIAVTQEDSAIYQLLKRLGIIAVGHETTPIGGHKPVLMVYTNHIGVIAEVALDAMQASGAMSAARRFASYARSFSNGTRI